MTLISSTHTQKKTHSNSCSPFYVYMKRTAHGFCARRTNMRWRKRSRRRRRHCVRINMNVAEQLIHRNQNQLLFVFIYFLFFLSFFHYENVNNNNFFFFPRSIVSVLFDDITFILVSVREYAFVKLIYCIASFVCL